VLVDATKLALAGGTMTGVIGFAAGQTFPGTQTALVSGTSIKTINGTSVLGSGNIEIDVGVTSFNTRTGAVTLSSTDVTTALGFTPVTQTAVDSSISALVDSSPATLNTLNELAAALGDDPNFATTVSASIAARLPLAGGTMTGAIGFAGAQTWPTFNQSTTGNAATATTLQTARTINGVSFNGSADITVADSTKLPLAGGTMTGAIGFAGAQTWPTFNQSTTGASARITVPDTRAVNDQPQNKTGNAITADFKENAAVGTPPVTASGLYSHVVTVAGWDTAGGSGGWPTQLSVGDGIAVRQAANATTWGAWRTVLHSNNFSSYALPLSGGSLTGSLTLTANSTSIRQNSTASWSGDAPNGVGKLEYHSNRWYINAGADSTEIANFRRGATSVATISNTGVYSGSIAGNAATATVLQTARTINGTSFNGSVNIDTTEWVHSDRDFPNGTLITTNINYAVSSGDPFVLEIRGNTYANVVPLDLLCQGYIYSDTIINHGGVSNGLNISGLVAINNGGNLCFWFPSQGYWNGYNVKVYTAYGPRATNRVTSITGVAKPTTAKEVALSANIRQSLHSGNYTSYSPTLTGTGASGTWGISISGTAANATNINSTQGLLGYAGSGLNIDTGGQGGPQVQGQGSGAAMISFHRPGSYAINFGLGTDNQLRTGGWSRGGNYVILDSGNYTSYAPARVSANRPGVTKLYRSDDDSGYNIQTHWSPDVSGYWSLRGYLNDSYHAPCYVALSGRSTRANGNFYIDDNYGNTVVGVYSASRYQGVFAMGDAYKLPADGTTTGSLYGMAWSHPNAGGAAGNLDSHGLLVLINGGYGSSMSYSIKASANVTAYSDERLKTNWRDLPENFVSRLAQVKVGIYDRIDGEKITQVGVSAQSLQELLPQAIETAKDEMQTLSVSYGNAALASAVELAKDNCELRARIERLESLINTILNKD
jgi:hypothetical protein